MNKNIFTWIIAAVLFVSLGVVGACSKDKDKDKDNKTPTTQPAPDVTKKPTPPTPAGPEIADDDLPVETDFEDEAESSITAENFMAELDALEKEISAEE